MGGNKMITDEQIREIEWQNGVYQLKKRMSRFIRRNRKS